MSEPETKVVSLAPIRIHRQTPIPWCTTHDSIAATRNRCKNFTKWDIRKDEYDCVISTGPPDHFWWKDE